MASPANASVTRARPRVALWGAGVMAGAHAAATQALGWDIIGVASRSHERAAALAGSVRIAASRAMSYTDALELPDIDLAIVSTPPGDHLGAAQAWTERGVAVLVSTPLCATLADADALVALQHARGVPMLFGSNLPASPAAQGLFRSVPQLGALSSVQGRSLRTAPTWGEFTSGGWGGGVLLHPGVHQLTLIVLVGRLAGLGAPTTVSAELRPDADAGAGGVDHHAEVTIGFADGTAAKSTVSWSAGHGVWDLQLASATAVARLDLDPHPTLEVDGDDVDVTARTTIDPRYAGLVDSGIVGQLGGFLNDIRASRTPVLDMEFGREVLDITVGAYASAGSGGAVVELPFTGPRDRTPLELWHAST